MASPCPWTGVRGKAVCTERGVREWESVVRLRWSVRGRGPLPPGAYLACHRSWARSEAPAPSHMSPVTLACVTHLGGLGRVLHRALHPLLEVLGTALCGARDVRWCKECEACEEEM